MDAGNVRHLRRSRLLLAVAKMDRIGHRRLQFIGFAVMALCFLILATCRPDHDVAPFLAIFGLSYFFVQFGPNMTTFVLAIRSVSGEHADHRPWIGAGIGKLGAFVGVFLVPVLRTTSACEAFRSWRERLRCLGSPSPVCSRSRQVGR